MSNITFVTGLFQLYNEDNSHVKKIEERILLFKELLKTGIKIYIYSSSEYTDLLKNITSEYRENIIISDPVLLNETNIGKIMYGIPNIELPNNRFGEKDIIDYIVLMNSKIEFVKKTIDINPWNTDYFCWLDFNIVHVFKDKTNTLEYLKNMNNLKVETDKIVIPGCWPEKFYNTDYLCNNVVWRFCGGVFLGHKDKLVDFYNLYISNLPVFLVTYNKAVWEVNFWAWLETFTDFSPLWYSADHNDSIIKFPEEIFAK